MQNLESNHSRSCVVILLYSYSCIITSMERQLILSVGAVLLLLFTVVSSQNCHDELEEADFTCFFTIGERNPMSGVQVVLDCPTTNFTAVSLGDVRLLESIDSGCMYCVYSYRFILSYIAC